jgi:hypothetical protein
MLSRREIVSGATALAACQVLPGDTEAGPVGDRRALLAGKAGNSAAVQQFFNRLVTLPTASRQALYANLINALVSGGVWAFGDALWVAGNDAATTLTNLINGTTTAAISGVPTFTANRGFTCNSSVNIITTNFNPSTGGQNFTQNSGSLGAWELTSFTPASEIDFIRTVGGANEYVYVTTGPSGGAILSSTGFVVGTSTGTTGWFFGDRSSSSLQTVYQNNSSLATNATASQAPENGVLLWWGNAAGGGQQHAAIWFGASLTTGQQTTLYNALQTYLHALGAV